MKGTIKESVQEVYKNTNNNAFFDKNIYNYDKELNHVSSLKKQNINNNTNKKVIETVVPSVRPNDSSIFMIILLCLFLFIIGIILYFRDKISAYVKQIMSNGSEEQESRIKELEEELENTKKEKEEEKEKEKDEGSKEEESTIKQNYSDSAIVKEDGFCFIGTDDNMRHCVDAYSGDICTSGDVYRRMDDCLIPKPGETKC